MGKSKDEKLKRLMKELEPHFDEIRRKSYEAGLEAGRNKELERLEGLHIEDIDDRAVEMTREAHVVVEAIGDKMTALHLKFEEGLVFTELIKSAMNTYQHINNVNQLKQLATKLEEHRELSVHVAQPKKEG